MVRKTKLPIKIELAGTGIPKSKNLEIVKNSPHTWSVNQESGYTKHRSLSLRFVHRYACSMLFGERHLHIFSFVPYNLGFFHTLGQGIKENIHII